MLLKLYHITSGKNSEVIVQNGFNKDNVIWATDDFENTFKWIKILSKNKDYNCWCVLKIVADEKYVLEHYSSKYPTQYKVYNPEEISNIEVMEEYNNLEEMYTDAENYQVETGIDVFR